MHPERLKFAAPIIVVMLGVAWLLDTWDVATGVNWVLTIGLATIGVCVLVVGGIDKLTVVLGPFLMAVSAGRLLLQMGRLAECVEKPIYVIVLGLLLLVAQVPRIPTPTILRRDSWPDE